MFKFSPAISLFVKCETQEEVDEFWAKLSEGGQTQQCGWLTDKFGVSWQIAPTVLGTMLQDKDAEKSKRVMEAMMKMTKLDIGLLKRAHEQRRGPRTPPDSLCLIVPTCRSVRHDELFVQVLPDEGRHPVSLQNFQERLNVQEPNQ